MLNIYHIKIIAIVAMTLDHIGLIFFPGNVMLRLVGRLAFPLFAWLIANGAQHTKNINSYALRLLVLAIISQAPFALAGLAPHQLNILFTLFLGLLVIICFKKTRSYVLRTSLVLFISWLSFILNVNYGPAGILSIVFFYIYYGDIKKMFWAQLLNFAFWTTLYPTALQIDTASKSLLNSHVPLQSVAVFSLIFIALYSGKQGPRLGYFFYLFYPLHLLILFGVKQVLSH